MEAIVFGIVLIVAAAVVNQYVPGPLGTLIAVALGLVGFLLLAIGFLDVLDRHTKELAALPMLLKGKRKRVSGGAVAPSGSSGGGAQAPPPRVPRQNVQAGQGLKAVLQDKRSASDRRGQQLRQKAMELKRRRRGVTRGRY